jgi:hypothetical protein
VEQATFDIQPRRRRSRRQLLTGQDAAGAAILNISRQKLKISVVIAGLAEKNVK